MKNSIERILISEEQINEAVKKIGKQITDEYQGKDLLMLCVLKGSIVFFADLIRNIDCHVNIDFIKASSYGCSTVSSGCVRVADLSHLVVEGRHIIIVEDILDTARTLHTIKTCMLELKPESLKIVTLLDKKARRVTELEADIKGFDIGNEFVVGYGLDYNEKFRNLPYIGVLKESEYK